MIRNTNGSIISYTFDNLDRKQVQVEVLSRIGGVSPEPWNTLNLGGTVGDPHSNVSQNKNLVIEQFALNSDQIFDVWQVHSADWIYATSGRPVEQAHQKADIIITDKPGLTLMMRFADCVPLFINDPVHKAVGIAHAGWVGTSKNVARCMVEAMQKQFRSKPDEMIAGIGPAICLEHYQVGTEVIDAITETIGENITSVTKIIDGKPHIDLKKANVIQFQNAGVTNIENSNLCTACDEEHWFSHRRGNGKTGRFGAFIRLLRE